MQYFWMKRTVRWGDCDAARVVWYPKFLEWFEEAEEEMYVALGRPRPALLERHRFGMPRVEAHADFHSPVSAGHVVRVGIASRLENPRRIRHSFEIREDGSDRLVATGFLRVGCVDWSTFTPRDLPEEVVELIRNSPFAGDDGARARQ